MTTAASARATRSVSSLAPTSTMAARPRSSRWLSSLASSPSDLGHRPVVGERLAAAVVGLAGDRGARWPRAGRRDRRAAAGCRPRWPENRQVRSRPSAVRRSRLHVSQKWSETPAMKPMVPRAPGDLPVLRRPVAVGAVVRRRARTRCMSRRSTSPAGSRRPSPPSSSSPATRRSSGMNSMKRTWTSYSRVSATKASSSSSTPGSSSVLILTGENPAAKAASMPASVSSSLPPRVMRANRSASRLSRLMLTRSRPLAASSPANLGSSRPLVVSEMSWMPLVRLSMPTKSAQPSRTSGSPPVMRTLVMPASAATRAKRRAPRSSGSRRGRAPPPRRAACSTCSAGCSGR